MDNSQPNNAQFRGDPDQITNEDLSPNGTANGGEEERRRIEGMGKMELLIRVELLTRQINDEFMELEQGFTLGQDENYLEFQNRARRVRAWANQILLANNRIENFTETEDSDTKDQNKDKDSEEEKKDDEDHEEKKVPEKRNRPMGAYEYYSESSSSGSPDEGRCGASEATFFEKTKSLASFFRRLCSELLAQAGRPEFAIPFT